MASLTFFNNIPQPSQRVKDSQPQIRTNFASLQTFLETNHVAFSSTDSGKHRLVELTQFSGTPVIGGTESAVYSKNVSGSPELFIKTGTDSEINLTSSVKASPGYTRLPGGILLKWGVANGPAANTFATILFPTTGGIPAFTAAPFAVFASTTFERTTGGDSTDPRSLIVTNGPTNITATQFRVYHKALVTFPSAVKFFWFAIGVG